MSLLKSLLDKKLAEDLPVGQTSTQSTDSLTPANPYNKRANNFSLLRDIHGAEITTGDVVDHLKKVDDEEEAIDTVAFGLETTDGQIVKVYVNAEQAEEFEQKMSQMLGKVDDIEEAIETLADEFDIVSVVKPGEDDVEDVDAQSPEADDEKGLENQLDEPLSDEDLAGDLGDQDLIGAEDDKEKKEKGEDEEDSKDEDGEADEEADEEDGEDDSTKSSEDDIDDLDFGDDEEDKPEESEEETEDKPEGDEKPEDEDDSESEETEDDKDESEESESEDDTEESEESEDDSKDGKDKKKSKKDKKDKDMKQEGQSLLKQLLSLNEAKEHRAKKPKAAKKEEPQHSHLPAADTTSADIFHMGLTKEESDLEKIFTTPMQQLIFRVALVLGVGADSIAIRKFKVRKSVKEVALSVMHQPQIRNVLNKLGKELAARRGEIVAVNEAEEHEEVQGTIKDQLSNEVTKKIYSLILALGIPEFLLTYKKTGLKNRIRNLAKIAVKHARIRSYIYQLNDMLKSNPKDHTVKESHLSVEVPVIVEAQAKAPSLLEDFAKSDNYADLGAFNVVNMGSVGGVELKVKDFTVELSEEGFEKLVKILGDGKAGVVKTENLGKVSLIPVSHDKEYVIKKVNAGSSDKYPFGVLISKKSIDRILA